MFLNRRDFSFVAALQANYAVIRGEFEGLPNEQLLLWPEKDICDAGWKVFGLWGVGQRFDDNCRLCPKTAAIVESIPNLTTAGFSRLAPGIRIRPHVGYTNTVLRRHLGLIVPENCGIKVGDETAHLAGRQVPDLRRHHLAQRLERLAPPPYRAPLGLHSPRRHLRSHGLPRSHGHYRDNLGLARAETGGLTPGSIKCLCRDRPH